MRRKSVVAALLGWLLLVPPIVNHRVVGNAPMAQWTISGKYATIGECADAYYVLLLRKHGENMLKDDDLGQGGLGQRNYDGYLPRCLSSDNPELSGNSLK